MVAMAIGQLCGGSYCTDAVGKLATNVITIMAIYGRIWNTNADFCHYVFLQRAASQSPAKQD